MPPVYAFSFVEDAPSAAALKKIISICNEDRQTKIILKEGFPKIMHGFGAIKKNAPNYIKMAQNPLFNISLVDLDKNECAPLLIHNWFKRSPEELPNNLIFRIAVKEIESWILADRNNFARFTGISINNFSNNPDNLSDPKEHLLNILRNKGTKKWHKDMLPGKNAYIGPLYNEKLINFINNKWSPEKAARLSPSLNHAMKAIKKA